MHETVRRLGVVATDYSVQAIADAYAVSYAGLVAWRRHGYDFDAGRFGAALRDSKLNLLLVADVDDRSKRFILKEVSPGCIVDHQAELEAWRPHMPEVTLSDLEFDGEQFAWSSTLAAWMRANAGLDHGCPARKIRDRSVTPPSSVIFHFWDEITTLPAVVSA